MTLQLSSSSANRITPTEAVNKVTSLLSQIKLTPSDLDATKTTNPPEELKRITKPQLFALKNGTLQPVTLLTETQVIRIDLYQADITYDLDTGVAGSDGEIQKEEITLPIVYPQPPYSTMNFLVSTYNANPEIVGANFAYQKPLIDETNQATYPIKTAEEAFEELQQGKGYVAAYFGTENNIAITDAYLAYYLGDLTQKYIMPVIVFEGNNGFFGYISAIRDDWITTTASQE